MLIKMHQRHRGKDPPHRSVSRASQREKRHAPHARRQHQAVLRHATAPRRIFLIRCNPRGEHIKSRVGVDLGVRDRRGRKFLTRGFPFGNLCCDGRARLSRFFRRFVRVFRRSFRRRFPEGIPRNKRRPEGEVPQEVFFGECVTIPGEKKTPHFGVDRAARDPCRRRHRFHDEFLRVRINPR